MYEPLSFVASHTSHAANYVIVLPKERTSTGNGVCPLVMSSHLEHVSLCDTQSTVHNEAVSSGNGRAKWPNYRAESHYETRGSICAGTLYEL